MGILVYLKNTLSDENEIDHRDVYDVSPVVVHTSPSSQQSTPAYHVNSVTIMTSVSAANAFTVTILVIVAILIYRKRRRDKRCRILAKHMATSLFRTTPFTVINTRRQLSDPTPKVSTYKSMDETNDIKVTDLELSQYKESKARQNKGNLTKYATIESSSPSPVTTAKGLKRSKSMVMRTSFDDSEHAISVAFTLKYVQKFRQLHLKLLQISDLSVKHYGSDIYAAVYLFPRNTDGVHSRTVRGGKNVVLNEAFLFDDMTLEEVDKSTLRLCLFYKKKNLSGKDGLLGEMFMECGDVDWSSEQPVPFNLDLEKNKFRTGTREKYLLEDLGSLFVCLEYQSVANRMKVMVRKASGLPKSDKLIGRPVHYVTVTLHRNNEVVKVQETKSQSGFGPIWNQPFLFDLSGCDISDCSFDFVIMRGKLHTKDTVVGHVTIGSSGCRSGRLHWREILSPRPTENAKWHSILPVLGT